MIPQRASLQLHGTLSSILSFQLNRPHGQTCYKSNLLANIIGKAKTATATKRLVDFNAGKTQLVLFDQSNYTGAIDVKMDGSVLKEKSSFKMLVLTFSSKLNWGSYIIYIAKTTSTKIGALIRSMKFLSPEVALYLYI